MVPQIMLGYSIQVWFRFDQARLGQLILVNLLGQVSSGQGQVIEYLLCKNMSEGLIKDLMYFNEPTQ